MNGQLTKATAPEGALEVTETITKPLTWITGTFDTARCWAEPLNGRIVYDIIEFKGKFHPERGFDRLGMFDTLDEAKAACDRDFSKIVWDALDEQAQANLEWFNGDR